MANVALDTIKKIERLYESGFQDDVVDLAIRKVIQRQIERDKADLARVESVLAEFEKKYNMSSDEFLSAYKEGKLPDSADFVEWSAFCKMRQRLIERLQILTSENENA